MKTDWIIAESGVPNIEAIERLGSKFLSGNGSIGLRGTLDEADASQKTAVLINGLYDKVGNAWREPINAPNPCLFRIKAHGQILALPTAAVSQHRQALDYHSSLQLRDTVYKLADGNLKLVAQRFVSLVSERLICLEWVVSSDTDRELEIEAGIDGVVWDLNGPHLSDFSTVEQDGQLTLSCRTAESGESVRVALALVAPSIPSETIATEQHISRVFSLVAKAGVEYRFHGFAIVADSCLTPDLDPINACLQAQDSGFVKLFEGQRAAWSKLWEKSDVILEGDDELQEALRFSVYHLLAIAPHHREAMSIPARGLSGQVYKGAIFWDTEIFMVPFFLNTHPELAKRLLAYRVETLDGARRKAAEYGYQGAFFAWESQDQGEDACTLYNVTDVHTGRPLRTFFRDKQIHISGDIAWAVWNYVRTTNDLDFLAQGGAELMLECAWFLADWMYYRPRTDRFELLDVTGPDEYHERVNNDFFTNLLSHEVLLATAEAFDLLTKHRPIDRKRLDETLDATNRLRKIAERSAKLYLPQPDPVSGIIPQFDGYTALQDIAIPDLLAKKLHPTEYLGCGDGLARWTQVIKQADVVLALGLFRDRYSEAVRRANWDYYEPRTEHGSSLSACAYAIEAIRLGHPDKALAYFRKTSMIDIEGSGKQYVGTLYIGGTHPAANGGAWWTLTKGFCGLQSTYGSLTLDPLLPATWKNLSFVTETAFGAVRITIGPESTALVSLNGRLKESLKLNMYGKQSSWDGSPLSFAAPHAK